MNSKDLHDLIQKNTRVILPEFGAFLVKDGGESGFNPTNVSFSPFLRYNDGMLEVFVAKNKGVSKEEATKEVREFVETVKNELQEKGFFQIETLGQLKRDSKGSLTFTLSEAEEKKVRTNKNTSKQSAEHEIKNESISEEKKDFWEEESKPILPVEPPVSAKKVVRTKAKVEKLTTKKSTKAKSIEEPIVESAPIAEERTSTTSSQNSEKETKQAEVVNPIQEVKLESIEVKKDDSTNKNESTHTVETKAPIITISSETKEDTKKPSTEENNTIPKKGHKYVLFSVIGIVIIALVFAIRYYYSAPNVESINENLNSIKTQEKVTNEDNGVQEKTEKPKDDIDKAFNEATTEPKEKQLSNPDQKKKEALQEDAIKKSIIQNAKTKVESKVKFYIVAGSFRNQALAEKFSDDLKKSGYSTIIVVQPSGMNAVALGSYSTREEANEASKSFKKKFPNIWILKK